MSDKMKYESERGTITVTFKDNQIQGATVDSTGRPYNLTSAERRSILAQRVLPKKAALAKAPAKKAPKQNATRRGR